MIDVAVRDGRAGVPAGPLCYIENMDSDVLCATSWRAKPRSFVALMTLYESNFIRLHWLVTDARRLAPVSLSRVSGDCTLELKVVDRGPYTTMLCLSYLFGDAGGGDREPALEIRVYHDAKLAEATAVGTTRRAVPWREFIARVEMAAGAGWARNMLLNKWLEYCAARGHRFPPACAATWPAPG